MPSRSVTYQLLRATMQIFFTLWEKPKNQNQTTPPRQQEVEQQGLD